MSPPSSCRRRCARQQPLSRDELERVAHQSAPLGRDHVDIGPAATVSRWRKCRIHRDEPALPSGCLRHRERNQLVSAKPVAFQARRSRAAARAVAIGDRCRFSTSSGQARRTAAVGTQRPHRAGRHLRRHRAGGKQHTAKVNVSARLHDALARPCPLLTPAWAASGKSSGQPPASAGPWRQDPAGCLRHAPEGASKRLPVRSGPLFFARRQPIPDDRDDEERAAQPAASGLRAAGQGMPGGRSATSSAGSAASMPVTGNPEPGRQQPVPARVPAHHAPDVQRPHAGGTARTTACRRRPAGLRCGL